MCSRSSGHSFRLFVLSLFGDYTAISHLFTSMCSDRQADRQWVKMVALKEKRVGGTETKFYQSLTSIYGHG